jgi:ankyrin repeat protein
LHLAILLKHEDVATLLIREGANINIASSDGSTPLHLAILQGQLSVATLLISKGANIQSATTSGQTPLHIAQLNEHSTFIEYLISPISVTHSNACFFGPFTGTHESAKTSSQNKRPCSF